MGTSSNAFHSGMPGVWGIGVSVPPTACEPEVGRWAGALVSVSNWIIQQYLDFASSFRPESYERSHSEVFLVIIHSEITKELNLTGNPRKWTYVYI